MFGDPGLNIAVVDGRAGATCLSRDEAFAVGLLVAFDPLSVQVVLDNGLSVR